jgi:hypothetical protein
MVSELVGQRGNGDQGYGDRVVQLDRGEYDYR